MYLNVCTLCCCTCSVSLIRAKHQVCPVVHTIFIIIGKCLCTITPNVSCVAFNGAGTHCCRHRRRRSHWCCFCNTFFCWWCSDHPNKHYTNFYSTQITTTATTTTTIQALRQHTLPRKRPKHENLLNRKYIHAFSISQLYTMFYVQCRTGRKISTIFFFILAAFFFAILVFFSLRQRQYKNAASGKNVPYENHHRSRVPFTRIDGYIQARSETRWNISQRWKTASTRKKSFCLYVYCWK